MIYSSLLALSTLVVSSAYVAIYVDDANYLQEEFKNFKTRYGKTYNSKEAEKKAYNTFIENLKLADSRNAKEEKRGGSAVHGITKFSDMSQNEFEKNILMRDFFKHNKKSTEIDPDVEVPYDAKTASAPSTGTVTYVDWTGTYTTPVKDQGYCGSCWAFSATEQIESDSMRLLGTDYTLGPEQIVECDQSSDGCNGGYTKRAFKYVKKAGGIETETNYPYTSYYGVTGKCKKPKTFAISLDSFTTITGSDATDIETKMSNYVQTTGPLSICLDASNWNSYTGGIMTVCGQDVDHCVQAVGVYPAQVDGFWKVRNQWGTDWGEEGYIQLAYGQNTCDLTYDPTYTVVSETDNKATTVTSAGGLRG